MRAVYRVAEKVCNEGTERRLFVKLAAQVPKQAKKIRSTPYLGGIPSGLCCWEIADGLVQECWM